MIIDDLLTLPKKPLIIVEGNIPPNLVAPLLTTKQQAIWMVSSEAFYKTSFHQREKHLGHSGYKNPAQTQANHIARDRLFVEYIKEETLAGGFELLEIDGSRSLSEVANRVEGHFATFLSPLHLG